MGHLSQHDLWNEGDNRVVALPPSPGDLLVVTTVAGRRVLVYPIHEYARAVSTAHSFARRWRGRTPVIIKVLSLTVAEAQAMGLAPNDLYSEMTPEQERYMRQRVIRACMETLHQSPDAAARGEALKLLHDLGVLQ